MSTGLSCCLVVGGARSGKSAYAEVLAESSSDAPWYLATAEAGDEEMQERVALHRTRRGAHWRTIEEPLDVPDRLVAVPQGDTVLIDCLTVWLGNLMVHGRDVGAACASLTDAVSRSPARLVLVANEVGLATLPDNEMAREFARHAGRLNQVLARRADRVVMLIAGCPMTLKPSGGA